MSKSESTSTPNRRRSLAWTSKVLESFSQPGYPALWLSSNFIALGMWAERLAVGWLVLVQTESVLLSAATFAARSAPGIIVAPIGGAVADRFPRNRLLPISALVRAVVILTLAYVAMKGFSNPLPIFVLIAFEGVINSFEMPAKQGLITDIVPRHARMNAIALHSVGIRAVGAVGALAGGVIAETLGIHAALLLAAVSILIGGAIVLFVPTLQVVVLDAREPFTRILREAAKGLKSLVGIPVVSTLLLLAVVVEIFGFAYDAVMPAMARDELQISETGLGTLRFATGIGAVTGAIALSLLGDFKRKGALLLAITMGYGAGLMGVALSPSLVFAIALVTLVGAMAAMFDAMQWTLLQATVPDNMRGRVIGGWIFAIGFGWLGHIALGAVADAVGVRWAIGGAGMMVAATSLAVLMLSNRIRNI